jgi:hypothetical protein
MAADAVRQAGGEITYDTRRFAFAADYFPTWVSEDVLGTVMGVWIDFSSDPRMRAKLGPHLKRLHGLRCVFLLWDLTDAELSQLPTLPSVEKLFFRLKDTPGQGFAQLRHLPRLKWLCVMGRKLGSDWSVFADGWPALDHLDLAGLDDAGAESLAKHVRGLSKLYLRDCDLSERGLRAIASIPGLKEVQFYDDPYFGPQRVRSVDRRQREQKMTELLPGATVRSSYN